MIYSIFSFDAQSWMKDVCHNLFKEDIFSSYLDFDILTDSDDGDMGFRIITNYSISMGDFSLMTSICHRAGCYFVVRSSDDRSGSFYVDFYLEHHG